MHRHGLSQHLSVDAPRNTDIVRCYLGNYPSAHKLVVKIGSGVSGSGRVGFVSCLGLK